MPYDARGDFTSPAILPAQAPVDRSLAHQTPSQETPAEESVPWDVVGVPRTAPLAAAPASVDAPWQPGAPTGSGPNPGAPAAYAQQWTPEPFATQYAPPYTPRRRMSGIGKIGIAAASIAVGFGVRWGFGMFFGGDFSSDGPIEVDVPVHWTTYSINNPDITYAMDSSWMDLYDDLTVGTGVDGGRMIDARTLTSSNFGDQAYVFLATSTDSAHGGKASRGDFEETLDEAVSGLEAEGFEVIAREETSVLTSDSGERWGFESGSISVDGVVIDYYIAVAVIADHGLVVEMIVPDGSAFTKHDLLAIANSVRER